ncbi:MAG TPA: diguanylate cyclase [bacterium]|nr:diguanylate cyclase [bacterium]
MADELSRLLGVKRLVEDYGPRSGEARAWFAHVRAALSQVDRTEAAAFEDLAAQIQDRPSLDGEDPLWIQSLLMVYRAIAQLPAPPGAGEDDLDALTGLRKRRVLQADLAKGVEQALAGGQPLALLLADLDQYNRVNYDAGPQVGDDGLKAVAAEVARAAQERGRVYRCGGDEMAVLLAGTGGADAAAIGEKLRAAIAGLAVPSLGRPVTASVGVAAVPEHARDAATLFEKASRALDRARDAGRNQVRLAE